MKNFKIRHCILILGSMFFFYSSAVASDYKVFSFDYSIKADTVVNISVESSKLKFTNNFLSFSKSISADCYSKSRYSAEKDGSSNFDKKTKTLIVNFKNFHECKISVPKGSTLNITAKDSKIKVNDSKFIVNLTATNSDVEFENIVAKANINMNIGKLDIENNMAEVNIKAQSSKVKIDDAKANLNIAIANTSDLVIDEDELTEYSYTFINKPSLLQGAFQSSSSEKAINITIDSDISSKISLD